MSKKINAIMIADTRPALIGNLLVQLKETNPNTFDVALIYYEKMSENDKKVMQEIMPCKFVKFNYNLPNDVKKLPAFKKFSPLMFARYFMFDLLKDYDTVTWLDTDVLICDDISSIIEKANNTGMSANSEDPVNKSYLYTDIVQTSFNKPIENYDMSRYNMSSGLITISRTLKNYEIMTKWCFDKTIELANNLILPDQGILNLLIQEFNINVSSVGENGAYCFYPIYKRDPKNAKVVHAWGARKFWKSWYLYNTYPNWSKYYQKWIDMGGSDIFGKINPDISIIIPSYKTNVKYFDLVLNDLLVNQIQLSNFQYDNFEIIMVIDGEISDELQRLFEKYDDPRLVIIHNEEKMGIAKSLNMGIKAAKGKYIARIDDDDRICNERLFKQKEFLDNNPGIDLVSSYFSYFGDLNEGRVTLEGEMCRAWSIFTCPFDHPTIMFRKEFFQKNDLFYDETRSHVEDWELWLRAFDKKMKVGVIPEILYYHRWYNGQAGQNVKTVEMMRELVRLNFEKLNVSLNAEELVYVSPWQGRVEGEKLFNLENIYTKALENNKKLKLYDQKSLETVFSYRLIEAKTGILSPLIISDNNSDIDFNSKNITPKESLFKRAKRKLLRPFYKPFRRIMYNIMAEAVNDNIVYSFEETKQYLLNLKDDIINNHQFEIDSAVNKNNSDIKKDINNLNIEVDRINSDNKFLIKESSNINDKLDDVINRLQLNHDNIYDFNQEFNLIYNKEVADLYFKKKIILIGTSEHGNIGDAAITLGVYEFLRKYFCDIEFVEITTYDFESRMAYLYSICNPSDLILLQGGGNLGNKYINEEIIRRKVIENFKNNKIIILPQTIYFDENGNEELKKSQEIYNKHKNLTIFTRGNISLEKAKKYFSNAKCYCFMDSALNLSVDYGFERDGILCCIRDLDDESGLEKETYDELFEIVKKFDNNFDLTTNTSTNNIGKIERFNSVYKQLVNFAKHRLVITDRLHGLIFALITNTPCIVLSSYNYKLKENYELVKENKGVTFIDKDINKLETEIKKYISVKNVFKSDYSKEFEQMASIIKGILNEKKQ